MAIIGLLVVLSAMQNDNDDRTKLITYAESYLGASYSSNPKKGFDCSGFVRHCYKHINLKLGRSSRDQHKEGKEVNVNNAQIGDIVVFKGSNKRSKIAGHVGLVHHMSHDTLYFIHASSSRGVIISHDKEPYYKNRFLGVVSVLNE